MTSTDREIAAAVLNGAADLIERGGWCQGQEATDAEGNSVWVADTKAVCFCANGAIYMAGEDYDQIRLAKMAMYGWLVAEDSGVDDEDLYCTIAAYNDNPERTIHEVKRDLRAVASGVQA